MGDADQALRHWFRQGGWTQLEPARAVGRLGQAQGYNVAPDSSRVRRWLEGERPRHPVPDLPAALFADRVGRPRTPADLGLAGPPTPDRVPWDHRALVTTLQDFTRSDLVIKRRDVLGATAALATGAVLEGMAALSYRTAAEHRPGAERKAEPHLAEALRLRRDTYRRSNLFDVISLVGVRVLQGEHAEANRLASTLLSPAGLISSTRTFDRIEAVRERAEADSARSKDARLPADTLSGSTAA